MAKYDPLLRHLADARPESVEMTVTAENPPRSPPIGLARARPRSVRRDVARASWYLVVDVPGPDGRRRQIKRRGFATKKAAATELAAIVGDQARGSFVRPSRMTVGSYLTETWLPARRLNLRASTVLGYVKVLRRIVPRSVACGCRRSTWPRWRGCTPDC